MLGLLALPLVWSLLPSAAVALPLAWSAVTDAPLVLPDLPGLAVLAAPPSGDVDGVAAPAVLVWVYAVVAGLLLLQWGIATVRLARLKRPRAAVVAEGPHGDAAHRHWLATLEQLRAAFGIQRPVQLLVSDQVRSPISWGVLRPVILVDTVTLESVVPDDVLRHELAHIARLDWLSLMLARIVVALYWFHPLAWLMLRQLQFNMECATDDAVLKAGGLPSGYAKTLVTISQLAHRPERWATPLAAQGRTLTTRIMGILEPHRQRQPVSSRSWMLGVLATLAITLPLGSVALVGEQYRWPQTLFVQPAQLANGAGLTAADALDHLGNPNYTALARALRLGDFEQRHALTSDSFKQRAAIAPLVLALHDANASTRRLAMWGLGEMRFAETGPVIAAMLNDTEPLVRAEAARALAELQNRAWIFHIVPLLQDTQPVVRANAAHALGDLADPRSLPALQLALPDRNDKVESEVRWAIREVQGGESE
jgi:beta-lactamase regulating signal transducer with metallopeptidase domain